MFCNHKWSEEKDRKQSCTKCNKVRTVSCPHKWKEHKTLNISYAGRPKGIQIILQCSLCGDMILKDFSSGC